MNAITTLCRRVTPSLPIHGQVFVSEGRRGVYGMELVFGKGRDTCLSLSEPQRLLRFVYIYVYTIFPFDIHTFINTYRKSLLGSRPLALDSNQPESSRDIVHGRYLGLPKVLANYENSFVM